MIECSEVGVENSIVIQESYKRNSIKLFLLICLTVCKIDVMEYVQAKKMVIDLRRGFFPALAGSYGVRINGGVKLSHLYERGG